MRPLLLSITGVKSINEKQTIDFERLSRGGIFGIFGKTGSGKSTILDSIVLALYGGVIGKGDKANFVNVDSKYAEVELVFSASVDGHDRKFRVIRTYKFDGARKNLRKPEVNLWEITERGEIPVAEGAKQVDECIKRDIIGLEKDDFLKCIALPQGEFSAFVKMTRGDRLKVIGKLFNLQKYGKELYDKVLVKDKQLAEREAIESGKLSGLGEMSDEYFESIGKEYQNVKVEAETKRKETELAREQYERAKGVSELVKEREAKNVDIEQKSAYKPVIEGFERKIKEFDGALILKSTLLGRDKAKNELKVLSEKLACLSTSRESKKLRFEEATKRLSECERIESENKALIEKRASITAVEKTHGQLKDKKAQLEELCKIYLYREEKIKDLQSQQLQAEERIKSLQESIKNFDVNVILQRVSEGASSAQLNAVLKQHLQFLDQLSSALSEVMKDGESAVNRLIGAQIQKTKALLTDFGAEIDLVDLLDDALVKLKKNTQLNSQLTELIAKRESNLKLLETLADEQARDKQNGVALRKEHNALLEEQKKVLGEFSYEQALSSVNQSISKNERLVVEIKEGQERAQREYSLANEEFAKLSGEEGQLKANLTGLEAELQEGLTRAGLTIDGLYSILSKEEQVKSNRIAVESFYRGQHSLKSRVEEINLILSTTPSEYFEFENFEQNYKNCTQNLEEINKKFGEISKTYEMGLKNYEKWCIIGKTIKDIKQERSLYGQLIKLVENNLFMEYIAEEYLKDIASIAESRVLELTNGKYGLLYHGEEFFIKDYSKGGVVRPVSGLSGGETFLVSLSLALALSNQIIKKAVKPINFFFLDEGFGTLDDELINTVTDSLEKLRQSNLTVGLITHVGELKNRIQSKLYVEGATPSHGTIITQSL